MIMHLFDIICSGDSVQETFIVYFDFNLKQFFIKSEKGTIFTYIRHGVWVIDKDFCEVKKRRNDVIKYMEYYNLATTLYSSLDDISLTLLKEI